MAFGEICLVGHSAGFGSSRPRFFYFVDFLSHIYVICPELYENAKATGSLIWIA